MEFGHKNFRINLACDLINSRLDEKTDINISRSSKGISKSNLKSTSRSNRTIYVTTNNLALPT